MVIAGNGYGGFGLAGGELFCILAASLNRKENTMDELEEHERQVAFEKKYVLRKDYVRDLELAKSRGRMEAATFCLLILPPILVCLFLLLRSIGWTEPGEFGIG